MFWAAKLQPESQKLLWRLRATSRDRDFSQEDQKDRRREIGGSRCRRLRLGSKDVFNRQMQLELQKLWPLALDVRSREQKAKADGARPLPTGQGAV
jgi:hypothetical protein